jgi:alpha-galactosidase
MGNIRISLIGAGSGCFSIALIRDLCLTSNLHGSTVSFMDIDEARLNAAYSLCRRYADELGVDLRLEKTMDRIESLTGADFVIDTALTAPHERLREGWDIARRYGFQWGGSYHVMYDEAFWVNYHQLRFFESLTEDILRVCPQAWHLMVANPVVAGITHITRKYPRAKVVGLCHGYADIHGLVRTLGLDRDRLTYEIPGVNHFVWLKSGFSHGEDLRERLDRWIETESEAYWKEHGQVGTLSRKRVDLYRKHGVFAIGDTANWSGAAWPWWYHADRETEERYAVDPAIGWNDYFSGVERNARRLKEIEKDPSLRVTDEYPAVPTDELMIPLVESLACDIPRVLTVNLANRGFLVPGIPEDFEVEVPALVSGRGIQGIRTSGLPASMLPHVLRDRVAPVDMELVAFVEGRRDFLVELVLMDRWATGMRQVEGFVDEILALPYHGEMRGHYR